MPRPVIGWRSCSKSTYEQFCKENPSIQISFKQYKKVLYTYNTLLITHLLETGESFKFPYGLGSLVINKYKPKMTIKYNHDGVAMERINLPIDWQETKKQGKRIYLLNAHTDGYKFYWMWNHWKARFKLSHIWKFEVARVHSRMLKTYLKKPNGKYKDIYREHKRKK